MQLFHIVILLTVKDHTRSNGCWVPYSLGHSGETVWVTVNHQTDVSGFQLTS